METNQHLGRFVPSHAHSRDSGADALWNTVDGTLCHIDISGFTSLSERLAARGRVGAEELTEVLDSVFGSMLTLVRERGGTLLKFGGDALLLLFEGNDHAVQAASAAVEMRAVLRQASEVPTSVGRLVLGMSIGLHSGAIHLFHASGSHRALIVAGPAATIVTEMEETASAGQIVVSAETKALLPVDSANTRKGNGWLLRWRTTRTVALGPRSEEMHGDMSSLIPTALRSHLTEQKADSEHRLATIAFVEFTGTDEMLDARGEDETAAALDFLVSSITQIADEEGITFLGTDVDRDAGKIILVSGAPLTLVDESGRVLRAARRIADLDTQFGLKIGVNRGHVFAGEIGTEHRSTYTVMGDPVNVAARLMAAAPIGSVFSTIGPIEDSRSMFETETLAPISVKGKAEPVRAVAVLAETGSRSVLARDTLPFTGREQEARDVRELVNQMSAGFGSSLTVAGPAGIGKSRLIEEALTDTDATLLEVRAEPYGGANPYRPLRDPMRELLGVERAPNDVMADALMDTLKTRVPSLVPFAPLVGDLAHVEIPPTTTTRLIESRHRQNRSADIAVELLLALVDGPLVLIFEDIHWADAATLSLVERFRREADIRPWSVLATTRNTDEDDEGSRLMLDPLGKSDVESLVFAATEAVPLRPDDVDVIVSRSGGNPLFVQELLKVVRETGDLTSLPTSLDGVVGSQIDALEPLARRTLRYLSVLGRSFRTSIAGDLISTQGIELNSATRSTLEAFLDDDGPDRIQFRHALLRDVAYEGLSFRRRQELHLRAGDLVLAGAAGDDDAVLDSLALHFFLGGAQSRAWTYCVRAGDRNMDIYANAEAATQFERALEAGRRLEEASDAERRNVWIKLGDVRERSGQFERSWDAYKHATKLTSPGELARAEVLLKRARARERAGEFVLALSETTRAAHVIGDRSSDEALRLLSHVFGYASLIRQAQDKPRLALKEAEKAAAVAESVGEDLALARAWQVMDYAYTMLGQTERVVYSHKALEIYSSLGELEYEAAVLGNLGVFAYFDGDWSKALEYYARGEAAFVKIGDLVSAAIAQSNIGEVYLNQGRYQEAEQPLRDARRISVASGFSGSVAFVDQLLGRMFGISGELDKAEVHLRAAIEGAQSLGQGGLVLEASIHLADALCRSGSPERGLETLAVAADQAPSDLLDFYRPTFDRVRGSILDSAGERLEAVDVLEEGIASADERGDDYEHGLLVLTLDRVAPDAVGGAQRTRARETLHTLGVRSVPGLVIA